MESTVELSVKTLKSDLCQRELQVEVPREVVEAEFDSVYGELKKVAAVPGFRVGYAPRDLLERFHGQKAKEEVTRRLIFSSLEEALATQGPLDLVGGPSVSQVRWAANGSLSYVAQMELAPQVPLGSYKRLSLTRPKIQITEEQVQQALQKLQEAHAELKPVLEPRPSQEEDYLLLDLTEEVPGKPPVKRRDVLIHLEVKSDPQGRAKELIGLNPGQRHQVKLSPAGTLTIDVKAIKVKEVSGLDDAFARSVGPFDSLQVLKEQIRKDLKARAEASQRRALIQQAYQRLLEEWTFDVPKSLVASQARRLLKERAVELMAQGVAPSQVEEQAKILSEKAKLDALQEVRLFFILRRIAQEEGITAGQKEIEERIERIAQAMRLKVDEVRQDVEARNLKEELARGIVREKVADLLLKEAEIQEG